jgi:VIT1/CCC1 family predicted Fe2+/Mn2+ transporter
MHELEGWEEEKRSAFLYRVVAEAERGTPRQTLFFELAHAADEQAALWERELNKTGAVVPQRYRPDLRTRIVAWLVRRLGPRRMHTVLAAMKVRGMSLYTKGVPGHFMSPAVSGPEHRHRGVDGGGNLRAAVFGVNDGLISNASLIMGVAAATSDNAVILLSGVAGLTAGAFSMAAGEYVSVRSQREMYEYQIGLEQQELDQYPEEEAKELALIYEARGLPREEAQRLAFGIIADPAKALDTLTREELGLNPEELGSPRGAAASSFASFAAGALIPLLPFLFSHGPAALALAIGLTALALFGVGATLSLFTGRKALAGGARMLLIGGSAGALTYLIGKLFGVGLG